MLTAHGAIDRCAHLLSVLIVISSIRIPCQLYIINIFISHWITDGNRMAVCSMFCIDCVDNFLAFKWIETRHHHSVAPCTNQDMPIAIDFHYANVASFIHMFFFCFSSWRRSWMALWFCAIQCRRIVFCYSSMKSLNWNCIWWCLEVYCFALFKAFFSLRPLLGCWLLISHWNRQTICKRYRFIDEINSYTFSWWFMWIWRRNGKSEALGTQ